MSLDGMKHKGNLTTTFFREARAHADYFSNYREIPENITHKVLNPIEDVIQKAGTDHNIVFADTDHRKLAILDFVAQPETLKSLAEAGVAHVFLERPQELDEAAKALADGTITREEFLEKMDTKFRETFDVDTKMTDADSSSEVVADLIENASSYGIKVHFADPGTGAQEAMDFKNKIETVWQSLVNEASERVIEEYGLSKEEIYANKEFPEDIREEATERLKMLIEEAWNNNDLQKALETLERQATKERWTTHDEDLAEFINRTANGEKFAVLYGAGHGIGQNDLNEHLEGEEITFSLRVEDDTVFALRGTDKADFIYRVDQDSLCATDEADQALLDDLVTQDISAEIPSPSDARPFPKSSWNFGD